METFRDPGEVLFGLTRRRVLDWLLTRPDERFFLRRIAREVAASPGAVRRELEMLAQAGILERTAEGRQVYFQANRRSPIFEDLQRLIIKTAGAVPVLKRALRPMASAIRVAWIYGSLARRSGVRSQSDVDLMIVGDVAFARVVDGLSTAQQTLGRDVNPTIFRPEEFVKKLHDGNHFLTSVMKEPKRFVIGDDDELGRLGQERVDPEARDKRGRNQLAPRNRRTRPAR